MKRTYTFLATLLLAFLLTVPTFAQEATQAVDATPTAEAVATEVAPPSEPVSDGGFFAALFSSDIVWQILIALAMLLLFRSVPKETLDKLEKRATETESTADDMAIKVLRWLNANKELLPAILPETPQPTITVTAPPSPTYTTSGGQETTITVSQPPVTVYPTPPTETPVAIVRTFGTFDPALTSTHKFVNKDGKETLRVVFNPVNTSPLFSNQNAAGTEYPYPSVNVNPAYGVQFDVSWIAGAWGFTVMETLVANVAYKVRLEYTAQITGDKVSSLPEWLWHELDVNGKVTGVNQGISNGVSYAEWGITGAGTPVMITPRIHCMWASAGDTSAIEWQRLSITPVVYGAEAAIVG